MLMLRGRFDIGGALLTKTIYVAMLSILVGLSAIPAVAQQPPTVNMTLQVKVPADTPSTEPALRNSV